MKMNKRLSALLAAILLLGCLSAAASAVTMGVVRMPNSDGSVWLRSGGGASYSAIGYAMHGDLMEVLKIGNSWNRVTLRSGPASGKTGWMYKKYITILKNPTDITGWGALAHIKTKYAASTVNLRKGPGTRYGVKDSLSRNELLIVLGKYNSNWYEVQVVNSLRTGYVHKDYISNGAIGTITANVNLRKSASTSARVLRVVPAGETVTVINVGSKWAKVKYMGTTGYLWNSYLNLY